MKNQQLSKSIEYERPIIHLTPEIGWMNDPNGFSWYDGKYHLFYQYNPDGTNWGPPKWGHVVSDDLINWQRLPLAFEPDHDYDSYGCFSGTAVDVDGTQMIMYTGFRLDPAERKIRGFQTQCIAFGDGLDYRKYEGNPVLTGDDLPEGGDPQEFRDPKIWQEDDGSFRAAISNHNSEFGGQILLYRSENGLQWEFSKVLLENHEKPGWMWECPDFFPMEESQVLLVSTMGDVECLCIIGDYDRGTESFSERTWQSMEQGLDFYAGQTVLAPDGRRILIGWMQNPQTAENREIDFPINGQMSIPRELTLKGDRITQSPVRELEQYRADKVEHMDVKLSGRDDDVNNLISLHGVSGRTADIEISIRPDDHYELFGMRFAGDGKYYTEFTYEPERNMATIDRSHAGPGKTKLVRKQTEIRDRNGRIDLRIILDKLSAEIFINDGEQVMSAVIYTDRHAEDITFYVKGAAVMDIVKYRIKENK